MFVGALMTALMLTWQYAKHTSTNFRICKKSEEIKIETTTFGVNVGIFIVVSPLDAFT
jgi:hypothetical protein